MTILPLSSEFTKTTLDFLEVEAGKPTLGLLEALLDSYIRRVPWESAFRIVRRSQVTETADCPRWPEIFWSEAQRYGSGGTCFESNYAFFSLLQALGYVGYLTVNNMNETIGCHTAAVVRLDGQKWLVDAGYPVFRPILLDAEATSESRGLLLNYTVTPQGEGLFEVVRHPHPAPYVFTLVDKPVNETDYRAATTNDYDVNGLFLDTVIINKVVDDVVWRFNGGDPPYHLESFVDGKRINHPITGDVAAAVAGQFGMDEGHVRKALELVKQG